VTVFVFAGECYRRGDVDKIAFKLEEMKTKELPFIDPPSTLSFNDSHDFQKIDDFKYKKTVTRQYVLAD
jgi:hypothetical protein